ncbi:MAG: macro domain-containing protein [Lachnospiraceae bacterium]|nr:macro domain-containing protein [Candidatus Colinaster scatohippi]
MPLKVVRNDITGMHTEAIVNTANSLPAVGAGCDTAIYNAAGYDELLKYRREKIGSVPEGEVFITPGFNLGARYIVHAVSPKYMDGQSEEEEKLRQCYRKSLALAAEYKISSIAFPLISTGSLGYPKEEGMRIAVDEINAFLLTSCMMVYLVVFDDTSTALGKRLYPGLEEYIDHNYVVERKEQLTDFRTYAPYSPRKTDYTDTITSEMSAPAPSRKPKQTREGKLFATRLSEPKRGRGRDNARKSSRLISSEDKHSNNDDFGFSLSAPVAAEPKPYVEDKVSPPLSAAPRLDAKEQATFMPAFFDEAHESKLEERMRHRTDTFSEYLLYLIHDKNMENAEVYKRAIIDKKVFSKIKNNPSHHPEKLTAMCLCVGAKLNLDETKDLLARAGYALSPCDKTDIIFSYFIENEIYDMIELDIQLEEHGLPCIIK